MNLLNKPLIQVFPNSNPKAIFFEIETEYELCISTWLGYGQHAQQELDSMSNLAIHVFEDIFKGYSKPIFVMVNHWDMIRDVYMLNQFEAFKQGNFTSRVFIDETQEEEKEQIYIHTAIQDINYKNILTKFIHRDYDDKNSMNNRIFFVLPDRQMYLLYFDSEIIIGANNLNDLKSLFIKYQEHVSLARKERFLAQK